MRFSDKIAYIHHDMDDAQRAEIITEDDIPITLRILFWIYHQRTFEYLCTILSKTAWTAM